MQEHEEWLAIAQYDLQSARGLLSLELYSTAVYHCQQAAEKAFKGYLCFKSQPTLKTHDLITLFKACLKLNNNFGKLKDGAEFLSPYATKFRYPTEFDLPEASETSLAIKYADQIVKLVLKILLEPESGQQHLF